MINSRTSRRASAVILLAICAGVGFLVPHTAHASVLSATGSVLLFIPGFLAAKIIMPIMALLVYLSGMILNWSVHYSVVDMSNQVNKAGIDATWTVIRDLTNMGFIFMLLYTAFMAMFGFGDWKTAIKNMVIAALLINFSLLITKAVIDASNVLALLFYKAIAPGQTDPTTGIASSFMNVLGLSSIYGGVNSGWNGTQMFVVGIGSSILELIAAFTFLAVAVMFLIRLIALIFVLALSPVYFLGMILPNAKSYAGQWKDTLVGQAFFAPIYFMLTWVALKVAQGLFNPATGGVGNITGAILGKTNAAGVTTVDPSTIATIINYFIVIGLMIAALTAAKKFASKSPGFINNITKSALGYAGGATLGLAGRAGRTTFGRLGANVADNERLKQLDAQGGIRGKAARLALFASNKTASSSFDLRNTGLGKPLGAGDVSKAAKKGFRGTLEQNIKDAESKAKSFNTSDFTTLKAEQDLNAIKDGTLTGPQKFMVNREKNADKRRAKAEVARLESNLKNYQARGASKAEIEEIEKHLGFAKRDLDAANGDDKTWAQSRVDRLKGFTKEDARKAAAKSMGFDDNVKGFNALLNSNKPEDAEKKKTAQARLDQENTRVRDKAEKVRKEQFARGLETPRILGHKFDFLDRVGSIGPTVRENVEAAAKIRKDLKEKTKEKKAAEAFKAMVEEEGGEGGTEAAPEGGTGGTPPASGGTTPPTP